MNNEPNIQSNLEEVKEEENEQSVQQRNNQNTHEDPINTKASIRLTNVPNCSGIERDTDLSFTQSYKSLSTNKISQYFDKNREASRGKLVESEVVNF